jgi:diaminohydroxyphosphoribosylaminopyrimidine deaminase/5-amino-6-(5-phosphoribosylamino)uracil reductase
MSLDGRIATSTGESRWISGPESRAQAHRLRSECDAVMVGIGTVLADDPQLNVRLDGEWRQPAKIIVDSTCRTPVSAAALVGARTIIAHTHAAPHEQREALAAAGAVLWEMPAAGSRVDLAQLLACMGADGLTSVLVEGGGSMLGTLIERKLVQRVTVFIAPNLIGGATAPGPVMGVGIAHMADVPRLTRVATQRFGDDIMITGLVAGSQAPQP